MEMNEWIKLKMIVEQHVGMTVAIQEIADTIRLIFNNVDAEEHYILTQDNDDLLNALIYAGYNVYEIQSIQNSIIYIIK